MIDEIDVHLHPRWKMEVVSSLRRSFPSVQFVVTTHEPLSLRGCKLGEVILLEESEGRVVSVTDLPSPEGLRVDQLLTSKFFGLHSTSDPDIEKLFGRYYMLLSKAVLSPEENGELLKMQKHVRRYGVLGYTRRDQIAYECIDLYLASEKKRSKRQGKALMNATIKKVVDIWEEMEDWQEGRG